MQVGPVALRGGTFPQPPIFSPFPEVQGSGYEPRGSQLALTGPDTMSPVHDGPGQVMARCLFDQDLYLHLCSECMVGRGIGVGP